MKLQVPTYNSDKFTWVKQSRELVAEASDFGSLRDHLVGGFPFLSRLYDDAVDVGFAVRSLRTGKERRFVLRDEVVSGGSLQKWVFVPEDGPQDLVVVVLNG